MASSNKIPPMEDYTTKLLLLEAVRCSSSGNAIGLEWIEKVLSGLALKWGTRF